jgi:branched-chain amino acid transport system substrate-binding protein
MRLSFATCLLLAAALRLAGDEPIKIGMFASLTGREASFGQTNHRGAVFAVEEINAAGGVLGRRLELIAEDTRSLQGEAATATKKLIARDKVVAVVSGTGSSAALEAAPICQTARVPLMAATATNPRVTEAGDYIFRACFIDPFQGTALAKFARGTLKAKRVAILVSSNNAYSVGLAKYFRERFTADGGAIVAETKYNEGDKDFRAQLTAIKAVGPDAIFGSGNYTEGALICAQARQLGLTVPLFGGDTWDTPALTEIAGPSAEGACFTGHFSPDSTDPAVQGFVHRFRARWGESPDTGTSLGYEAVQLLADGLRRAGSTDGARLRAALATTKDFPGVTGRITIDAQRNASKSAVIFTVKDGRFVYVESVAP